MNVQYNFKLLFWKRFFYEFLDFFGFLVGILQRDIFIHHDRGDDKDDIPHALYPYVLDSIHVFDAAGNLQDFYYLLLFQWVLLEKVLVRLLRRVKRHEDNRDGDDDCE